MIGTSIVLVAVGLFFAQKVKLDSDLKSLLPKRAQSVVSLEKIDQKAGGTRDFKVVLWGGSFENRLKAAEAFKNFLETQDPPFAKSVRFKTPKDFFETHKFKLIPVDSLDSILSRIERERKKNAAVVDPLGLEATIDAEKGSTPATNPQSPASEDEGMDQAKQLLQRLEDMLPYYQTKDEKFLAIRILPAGTSFNIESNRKTLKQLDLFLRNFNWSEFDPQIKYEILGSIPNHISRFDSISRDVQVGGLGILVILLLVSLYFRTPWALLTTVPPLVVGLSVGMGLVALFEGALNSIAIFLVLVVFGVGIEFGIHLWARFTDERRKLAVGEALEKTWRSTGRATLTSSTALLCGFALLTLSSFQGFAQFGRVAIILVMTAAGAFVIFMPAWILLTEKLRGSRAWTLNFAEWLLEKNPTNFWPPSLLTVLRWTSAALVIGGAIACYQKFRFDYTFEESVKARITSPAREALGEIFSERLAPSAVAVFKSEDEAAQFMEFYRAQGKSFPEIHLMSGLSSFLPRDQNLRIEKIQTVADELEPEWIDRFEDPLVRKALKEMKVKGYDQVPIQLSDIPPETREPFMASDGSGDSMVFLFDDGGAADGRRAMRFRADVEKFIAATGLTVLMSGNEIIFADIVSRVVSEGPWLVLGMFILVFLICWLDFRNLKDAATTLAPVVAGFVYTGFVLVIEGTMINFFNMVALASLGAMVVDNSIHTFHRFKEFRDEGDPQPDRSATFAVGPTVFLCTLTSICGYGGMAFANHNGIASLGWVAIVGLLACFISAIVFFPAWLSSLKSPVAVLSPTAGEQPVERAGS